VRSKGRSQASTEFAPKAYASALNYTIMVLCNATTEKRKPTYDLEAFKTAFADVAGLNATTALKSAAALGFGRADIVATVQTMQRAHFYKSMTSYADHKAWQDVYHVPSEMASCT
jgi:motility quorum-sensing regulator / GCU-specific mRNA interferase toxin